MKKPSGPTGSFSTSRRAAPSPGVMPTARTARSTRSGLTHCPSSWSASITTPPASPGRISLTFARMNPMPASRARV